MNFGYIYKQEHSRAWVTPVLLVAAVFIVYLNSFSGVFHFDDHNVIVNNPSVHSFLAWLKDLKKGIRPVLKLTYTLNWVSGLGLFGFHLVNTVIHAANAVLVYFLTFKMLESCNATIAPIQLRRAAFLAGMLFALHPVQTEAVTYISSRSTSLMTLFYLCSISAYIYGAQNNKRVWLYLVSPLLFVFAVATKEAALTLPIALVLWDVATGSKKHSCMIHRQAVHWVLFAVITVIIFLVHSRYSSLLVYGFKVRSLHDNFLSQINGITYLITRLFYPHRLNIDPDLPEVFAWSSMLIGELAMLLGLLIIAVWKFKTRPWLSFGIFWFFLHLLPTNSVIPRLDIANERQLYLANLGISLLAGVEFHRLAGAYYDSIKFKTALVVLVLVLGVFTVRRNTDYHSEIALWENTAQNSPQKARVFNNLGYAYEMAGFTEKAGEAYLKALKLAPGYSLAKNNLYHLLTQREAKQEQ